MDLYLTPLTEIDTKCIKHVNVECGIKKFLEGNIAINLLDMSFGNGFFFFLFLDMTPRASAIK